jgi:DNA-binding CsgD family transcriptional regulator
MAAPLTRELDSHELASELRLQRAEDLYDQRDTGFLIMVLRKARTELAMTRSESAKVRFEYAKACFESTRACFEAAKACRELARSRDRQIEAGLPASNSDKDRPASPRGSPARQPSARQVEPEECRGATDSPERSSNLLTERELEVLKYIAQGHSTKQVAGILAISFKTVACHRYRVMGKLGIHDTATLVRYAIRSGFVQA